MCGQMALLAVSPAICQVLHDPFPGNRDKLLSGARQRHTKINASAYYEKWLTEGQMVLGSAHMRSASSCMYIEWEQWCSRDRETNVSTLATFYDKQRLRQRFQFVVTAPPCWKLAMTQNVTGTTVCSLIYCPYFEKDNYKHVYAISSENTAGGISNADHVAPTIRKS
jgi:hypothetical protein